MTMNTLYCLSPLMFGIIIGILIFYFVRQYKKYTAKQLSLTISILLSGSGIPFLIFILGNTIGSKAIIFYMLGIPIGFLIYFIYLIVLAFIYKKDFIDPHQKYNMFASCNLSNEEYEYGYLLYKKADKLNRSYKLWSKNKLSDKEFIDFIAQSSISKQEYKDMSDKNKIITFLEDELVMIIDAKHWGKYFKD